MNRPLSDVTRDAMNLPVDQRLSLVRTILGATDLEPRSPDDVDQAWEDEIAARIRAVQAGEAEGRSWGEILKDIDARSVR